MGDAVDLHGRPPPLEDHEFITDLARYADGVLTEAQVKKKYRLADETWEALGADDSLVEAIEAEKIRRIRNGATARERAQALFTKAPEVLGGIMNDPNANPRHRIESAKEIRAVAANGPDAAAPASDRFQIIINLGEGHIERFDKSIAPNPNDVDPNDMSVITAKEDDGGEPV